MENIQIIQPSILLTPYIKGYWFLKANNVGVGSQRVIPSGLLGFTINRGEEITLSNHNDILPETYVYGQTLKYTDIVYQNNIDLIIILLKPMGARLFLKSPVYEFNESVTDLRLVDPDMYSFAQLLGSISDNDRCVSLIEYFLTKRLFQSQYKVDIRFHSVFDLIDTGTSDISILAQSVCLGYKQFKRLFFEYTGLNPKDYLRINRCSRLLRELQSGSLQTLDDIAIEGGYYDKSHLIKELKTFTNYTPTGYVVNCDPFERDKLLFQTIFVENN